MEKAAREKKPDGEGVISAPPKNCLCYPVPTFLSPDKKDRAERDPAAGRSVQIIWVGEAEEAVLGQSLYTSQMVF